MKKNIWTEERIKDEMRKCNESPYYFATTYLIVKHEGKNYPFETLLSEKEFNNLFLKTRKNQQHEKKS